MGIGVLLAFAGPVLFLMITAILSALIAYPIFLFSGAEDISLLRSLISRIGQGLLLLGIYPLFKSLSLQFKDLGYRRHEGLSLPRGFGLGALMLGLHVAILLSLQIRLPTGNPPSFDGLALLFLQSLATGLGVALLEETLFRGALLAIILRLTGPIFAVTISAFFYAGLHFIGTKWTTDLSNVGWDTPFRIAFDGFSHVTTAPFDAFMALFVAGLFLGTLRLLRPEGLFLCLGIHAGWVFVIKISKVLSYPNAHSPLVGWISAYDYVIGSFSCLWLSLLLALLIIRHRRYTSLSLPPP
jgi:uncharacterized protein